MKKGASQNILPQVVSDLGRESTPGSDPVKARVASGSGTDSGDRTLHLDSRSLQVHDRHLKLRSNSVSSVTSNVSAVSAISAFSNQTAKDCETNERAWHECLDMKKEEDDLINKMEKEINQMLGTFKIQTNVNKTIKEGLPKVQAWLATIALIQTRSSRRIEDHHESLVCAMEAKGERERIKNEVRVQFMRDAIRADARGEKRDRSPRKSPGKKKKKVKLTRIGLEGGPGRGVYLKG